MAADHHPCWWMMVIRIAATDNPGPQPCRFQDMGNLNDEGCFDGTVSGYAVNDDDWYGQVNRSQYRAPVKKTPDRLKQDKQLADRPQKKMQWGDTLPVQFIPVHEIAGVVNP